MDKEKEGLITSLPEALTEAAKINMAATKDMASSAVTAFVDAVTGREKPRSGKRRVSKKKASSASKRSKTTRSATGIKPSRRTAAKKPARKGAPAKRRTATKARGSSSKNSQKVFHKIARLKEPLALRHKQLVRDQPWASYLW